jgi:alkylation response protein AidB-like acyl-CoA dehydrogenase
VGDEYIVNGQKVWTSFADKSDFLFCLVRTDFSATKHNGISVLLIDMESAGVTARPIELISGTSHFCEVFLDNVKVPKENLLGELNKGWTIAKRMLQHERNMMGKSDLGDPFRPDLAELAIQYIGVKDGRIGNGELRAQIVANKIQHHVIEATSARVLAEMKAGSMGAASSIMKYALTIAAQEKFELMLNVLGNKALGWQDEESFAEDELRTAKEWAFSKVQTIGGGTSEVQLNIIAKHILGLPD